MPPRDLLELEREFGHALESSLAPWRRGQEPLAVLFSGGLDSGLLAWELRARPNLVLVTAGLPSAPDLRAGETAAKVLSLPWQGRVLDLTEIRRVDGMIAAELDPTPAWARTIFLALACALAATPGKDVVCGQGADELFLGYRHFAGLSAEEAAQRARDDLARLRTEDWPRTERIARLLGRRIGAPFLDARVVRAVESVPIALRLPRTEAKALLRAWAEHRGLDPRLARRPKKALQYGSGIDRLLRPRRAGPR